MLIAIKITANSIGKTAFKLARPVNANKIAFKGMQNKYVNNTPIRPDAKPMMTVSTLNIPATSRLDAPTARKIPISLVRSCTEISVITPIMMEETIKEMETNAIKTKVMALMMVVIPLTKLPFWHHWLTDSGSDRKMSAWKERPVLVKL